MTSNEFFVKVLLYIAGVGLLVSSFISGYFVIERLRIPLHPIKSIPTNSVTLVPNIDRFQIENVTKEDTSLFMFVITDKQSGHEYLYIKSAAGASTVEIK
jgi:hypothetical protein